MTNLLILKDLKKDSYNLILFIIDKIIKIVHYKLNKNIIDVVELIKVIINLVIRYYGLSNSIIYDESMLFILKFLLFLYYSLNMKKKLFIAFHT